MTKSKPVSDHIAKQIDEEIRAVIDRNYERARDILTKHLQQLHLMAEALIKYETLDLEQLKEIMSGQKPTPPKDWIDHEPVSSTSKKEDSIVEPVQKNTNEQATVINNPASDIH